MVTLSTEEIGRMVSSLFEPDTGLDPQYLETVRRKTHLEAEQELMLAVLEDAVTCFQVHFAARDKIKTRLFRKAEEWILQQEKSNWLFSFDNVCETLGLNPDYIVRDCCTGSTIGLANGIGFEGKQMLGNC